jgi:catechol 2,3-dioxygenase-like lactoylglutathione lyase family enzyme
MAQIPVETLIHVNQLLGDFEGANRFYQDVFAAREYMNSYHEGEERDASLFLIGDTCIELFSPRTETSLLGRQLNRFGDCWHSWEWKVPDLAQAKAVLDDRGIRCGSYYPGAFLMTHPKDTHGMILELCPHDMANDPRLEPDWTPTPWQEHPMGIEGLDCVSVAATDMTAAVDFLVDLVGAEPLYEVDRPLVGGRAVGLQVADHVVEIIGATDPDARVGAYLAAVGARLRSIRFTVRDLSSVERHLASKGIGTVPGDFEGSLAIDPADNYGVLWQFTEQAGSAGRSN